MKELYVIKNDGRKEPFEVEKIRRHLKEATKGTNINYLEIESKVSFSIKNNIKTSEIQDLLVLTAVSLITPEKPDMALVAGRLAMRRLHREIFKNSGFTYKDFDEFLKYAVRNSLYRKDFLSAYDERDIKDLSKRIKEKHDYNMNISQVLSLKGKYLMKNKRGNIEYPQFADMASSMVLASVEEDPAETAREYFDLLVNFYISLATPFKSNLRLQNGNTGSCFIVPVDDNMDSISKTWKDMAYISKEGGGIGVYLGKLRPEGSWSPNIPKANNITRWTKIINDIAVAVNQRGIRKGAITPALDWWHMDIFSFIEMKSETGGELREKCFDLFPQIVVDDYFTMAVLEDREVYLFDQFEFKNKTGIDVTELIEEELWEAHEKVYEMAEEGSLKHVTKIKAKDLWKESLRVWFETGDFYITHKDMLNYSNYLKGEYITNSANLCVESFSINKVAKNWATKADNSKEKTIETDGLYHSCNLISINVGIIHSDELLERVCTAAVRMLDASIELGSMPVLEAEKSSRLLRNIGIGTVGTADWMAYNKLSYEKEEDLVELEKLYEKIAWYCYSASIELAQEKGSYPLYEKADYSKILGKDPKTLTKISPNGFNWEDMAEEIKEKGIRNFLLLAIAPNTSTGILMGSTASYLPPQSKFNYQTLSDMSVPILPRYLKSRYWYYKGKYQYAAETLIKVTKRIQTWVDTGISMEVFINPAMTTMKNISDEILTGFRDKELKAVYYSLSIDGKDHECTDCAN